MEKIIFMSDSPSDLLPGDTAGKPYLINSSSVVYDDGRVIREVEVDRDEYYQFLKTCKNIPTTAMGTPEQWVESFYQVHSEGYTHVIILTISSTASSVAQSIGIAIELFEADHPEKPLTFEIIDSRTYSLIYGRFILEGLRMNEEGKSFAEIVDYIRKKLPLSQAVLGVYSLQCMKKSGRVSGMSAFVGEALGIRPVLFAQNGKIVPIDKARGDKNLIPKIVDHVKTRIVNPAEQELYILHGSIPAAELDRLEATLSAEFAPRKILRHNLGVTVVTNSGPETIVVVFNGEPYAQED